MEMNTPGQGLGSVTVKQENGKKALSKRHSSIHLPIFAHGKISFGGQTIILSIQVEVIILYLNEARIDSIAGRKRRVEGEADTSHLR